MYLAVICYFPIFSPSLPMPDYYTHELSMMGGTAQNVTWWKQVLKLCISYVNQEVMK